MIKKILFLTISIVFFFLSSSLIHADIDPVNFLFLLRGDQSRTSTTYKHPENLDITVQIEGYVARTTVRFNLVHNVNDTMEGLFDFILPEHSVITDLKLDIENQLVSGVGVEKHLANIAYRTETGRRIDPALIEKRGPGHYLLRVYPLVSGIPRTIEFQWIQKLGESPSGRLIYQFPFTSLGELHINSFSFEAPIEYDLRMNSTTGLFDWHMSVDTGIIKLESKDVSVEVKDPITASIEAYQNRDIIWLQQQGNQWYSSVFGPQLSKKADVPISDPLSIIWDASFSRNNRYLSRQLNVLKYILDQNNIPVVYLSLLRNKLEEPIEFYPLSSGYEELYNYIESIVYDGFSDISSLEDLNSAGTDFHLFFTSFLEYSSLNNVSLKTPVYVFSQSGYWFRAESILAAATGGNLFNVIDHTDELLNRKLRNCLYADSLDTASSNWFDEISSDNLTAVHGEISQADKKSLVGEIKVMSLIDNYYLYVVAQNLQRNYHFRYSSYTPTAQLASSYNIVSDYSSLLVLETPEQYVRWGIIPPGDVPWDYSKYEELLEEKDTETERSNANFVTLIDNYVRWNKGEISPGRASNQYFSMDFALSSLPEKPFQPNWGCFIENTPVHTTEGIKPIQSVEAGDLVFSYDPSTSNFNTQIVTEIQSFIYTGNLFHLYFEDETLHVTGNHPFLVLSGDNFSSRPEPRELSASEINKPETGRWVDARDLNPGDKILLKSGNPIELLSLDMEEVNELRVYNFLVDTDHTYLVGLSGIVVHNNKEMSQSVEESESGSPGDFSFGNGRSSNVFAEQTEYFNFESEDFLTAEGAYELYLKKRESLGVSSTFFVEAAHWFYKNGELDLSDRIISNIRETMYGWNRQVLTAVFYYESIGDLQSAIDIIESYKVTDQLTDKMLIELTSLYVQTGERDKAIDLLEKYIPQMQHHFINRIYYDIDAIGGPLLSVYLDYLILTNGINDLEPAFRIEPQPADWQHDIRIKALWDTYEELSLLIVEPSGEVIFYDNMESNKGGLFFSNYYDPNGPDEYLNDQSETGVYEVYILRRADGYDFNKNPYTSVKVTVILDSGTSFEDQRIYFIKVPVSRGLYKVTSFER